MRTNKNQKSPTAGSETTFWGAKESEFHHDHGALNDSDQPYPDCLEFAVEQLKWGPMFEMGIPELDAQHRRLFALVNQTLIATQNREERVLEAILDQLVDYVKVHFAEEEARMAEAGFPDLESHIREHLGFKERVTDLYSRYLSGNPGVALELAAFLRAWLVSHIQGSDRHYVPYLLGTMEQETRTFNLNSAGVQPQEG